MKKLLPVLGLVACGFASCESGYQETHKDIFKDQIWTKGEVITLHPMIHETAKSKTIAIDVQHIYGYDIKGFELLMKLTAPSGAVELEKSYFVRFKNDDGTAISQCSGDYCDVEQILESNFTFKESGEYTLTFEQDTQSESVAGLLSIKCMIKDAP